MAYYCFPRGKSCPLSHLCHFEAISFKLAKLLAFSSLNFLMKHGLLKLKCHEHTSDHSIYKVTSLLYLLSFAICQTLKGIWGILSGPQSALIPSKELSVGELRIYWKEYWKIGTGSFKTANCNLSKLAAWEHNYPKRQFSVDINFVLLAAAHLLSSRPTNQPIQPNTFHKYYHLSLRNYCGRYYLFIALFQATSVGFTHPSFLPASHPACLPCLSGCKESSIDNFSDLTLLLLLQ